MVYNISSNNLSLRRTWESVIITIINPEKYFLLENTIQVVK